MDEYSQEYEKELFVGELMENITALMKERDLTECDLMRITGRVIALDENMSVADAAIVASALGIRFSLHIQPLKDQTVPEWVPALNAQLEN